MQRHRSAGIAEIRRHLTRCCPRRWNSPDGNPIQRLLPLLVARLLRRTLPLTGSLPTSDDRGTDRSERVISERFPAPTMGRARRNWTLPVNRVGEKKFQLFGQSTLHYLGGRRLRSYPEPDRKMRRQLMPTSADSSITTRGQRHPNRPTFQRARREYRTTSHLRQCFRAIICKTSS